jgi:hypothetical protein
VCTDDVLILSFRAHDAAPSRAYCRCARCDRSCHCACAFNVIVIVIVIVVVVVVVVAAWCVSARAPLLSAVALTGIIAVVAARVLALACTAPPRRRSL